MTTKFCSKSKKGLCAQKNPQPVANFNKDALQSSGLATYCKSCANQKQMRYYGANKQKVRDRVRKQLYGISSETYKSMHAAQNGLCAICKKAETATGKKGALMSLAVDHRHSDGAVRALLCKRCNRVLGSIKDNFDVALGLAKYIQHHEGVV